MSMAVEDPPVTEEESEVVVDASKTGVLDPTNLNTAGWPYEFEVVAIDNMVIDEDYQRPLTSLAKEIAKDFEPALIGTVCLSKREPARKGGKVRYAVIDGQNRMVGAKSHTAVLPSIVYKDLTVEQEAALFSKFQLKRRGMTSASRFRAQVRAGIQPQLKINTIVEECGFFIEHNSSDPKALKAVAALEFLYQGTYGRKGIDREDPQLIRDVLAVISQAWSGLPDTAKGKDMLKGLGWFLAREPGSKKFQGERTTPVQMDRLVARLAATTPSKLASRAQKLREAHETSMTGNAPAYLAEAIFIYYDSKNKIKD